jgi:hypothetical protein
MISLQRPYHVVFVRYFSFNRAVSKVVLGMPRSRPVSKGIALNHRYQAEVNIYSIYLNERRLGLQKKSLYESLYMWRKQIRGGKRKNAVADDAQTDRTHPIRSV